MTRVAGVPEQLEAASAVLVSSEPELDLLAGRLASAPLPAMPAGVGTVVAETLLASSATLRRAAAIAGHEGVDLRRRGLWLRFADAALAAWGISVPVRAAAEVPIQIFDLVERRRAKRIMAAWAKYDADAAPAEETAAARLLLVRVSDSPEATRVEILVLEHHPGAVAQAADTAAEEGHDWAAALRAAGVPLRATRELSGKVLGPVGFVGGVWEMFKPEHRGWEGIGDRVTGGAGAVGSLGSAALSIESLGLAGGLAAIPGVDVGVAVLLLGAAGWELYTHKKEIAKAGVATGKFLVDHRALVLATTPELEAANVLWSDRHQAAQLAVTAGDFAKDRAADAAGLAVSVGKTGLHGFESGGSTMLHAGGDAAGELKHVGSGAVHEGKKLLGKIGL